MAKLKPNGTAIDITGLAYADYKAMMAQLRTGDQRSLRELGYMFAVEGNAANGAIRMLTNASVDSDIVDKLKGSLGERYSKITGTAPNVIAEGTRLSIKNSHLDHAGTLAALKKMSLETALGVEYDRSNKTVTLMHEVGKSGISSRVRGLKSRATQAENNSKALQQLIYAEDVNDPAYDDDHIRMQNLIKTQPDHPLAMRYASMMQKINNRDDRARQRAAERDPNSPEFATVVEQRMDTRVARENAQLAWAKKNKHLPIAKALKRSIKRRRRSATAGGRLINKLTAAPWQLAVVAAVIGIVSLAGKMFSSLLHIGSTVHDIKMKGARYNVASGEAAAMITQAKYMRLSDDVFSQALGTLSAALSGPQSAESFTRLINAIAPMSANMHGRTIEETIALFLHNKDNPVALLKAILSESFEAYTRGQDVLGRSVGEHAARRSHIEHIANNVSPEIAQILERMIAGYHDATELQGLVIADVQKGKSWYDAVLEHVFSGVRAKELEKTFPQNERNVADNVHGIFKNIEDTLTTLWDKLMGRLFASLEPVALFGRGLLRWMLNLPGIRDIPGMAEVGVAFDREAHEKNIEARVRNTTQLNAQQKALETMSTAVGVDVASVPDMVQKFTDTGYLPMPFAADGIIEGLRKFIPFILLQGSIMRKQALETKFIKEATNAAENKIVHEVGEVGFEEQQRLAYYDLHDALNQYRKRIRIIDDLETDESWDTYIEETKQFHIGNAKVKYDWWDKSDSEIWRMLTNPADEAEGVYYNGYRGSYGIIDDDLATLHNIEELKQIDALYPGMMPSTRHKNAQATEGSTFLGIWQRTIEEASKRSLSGLLENPETEFTIRANKDVMDIEITLVDKANFMGQGREHREHLYVSNQSNVTFNREGLLVELAREALHDASDTK